ncbi:MAG: tRNA (adenosine(37)-N6)-dimethylallyltransferase MiaA [Alteraurantiacibacter sp.]
MSTGENLSENRLALIAGPTASGKSDLAVRLAQALDGPAVVINADSAQVYSDLHVLSARPTEAETQGVPHRLFGAWDGAQACSATDWAAAAKREIGQAHLTGAVPILVGGTGLYIRTLLEGIAPIPEIDPRVREDVRALSTADAYSALQGADPERAAMLHPSDSQRIARALEVVRSTGRTLGEWQARKEGGIADAVTLAPLVLLPEREALYARCDARFAAMMEQGAVGEVEALIARRLSRDLPVMRAIGVPEIAGWLSDEWSREEAVANGQRATRNYAKRQFTWLRHQTPPEWPRRLPNDLELEDVFATILQL